MAKLLATVLISMLGVVLAQEPVQVSVYYATKCPDSMNFVTTQLWPTYQQVSEIFTVTWVPFGYSNFTANGTSWDFYCEHGPEECDGNIAHSCAIKYYPLNPDNVPFVSCAMSQADPPAADQACAIQYGLDWNVINTCATGPEGPQLLHENGLLTDELDPPLYWMPTVLINGVYTDANQDLATTDFIKLVCDNYTGTKPSACPTA